HAAAIGSGVLLVVLLAWAVMRGLERLAGVPPPAGDRSAAAAPAPPPPGVPRITATFFYGSEDGEALVPVRREVALADGTVPQAREILLAQLQGAPAPYTSVIPDGTALRAFYATERGDAFVDLSGEISARHPGGTFTELLTVYAIVHAITANLPTIQRVQILVDGREVDTLAGHVDLRRPLEADPSLVRDEPQTP
ncbi:MAG: GerMN domain-containing protein, partial [Acidobacteria bacterium]|nr:GerMN domain-containing protein [Acidobacteriota bacterium]